MDKRIITVSREFGSGGRSIAKELANRLGWKYYDKELVKQVADETGFSPEFIEERGELASSGSRLAYAMFGRGGTPGVMKLAEQGNCVIVGRCADYILRDREDAFHIFIHAPMSFRADRIVRLYGESEHSPEQRLQDKDKRRRVNYQHYTGREWGMSQNYNLCLILRAMNRGAYA